MKQWLAMFLVAQIVIITNLNAQESTESSSGTQVKTPQDGGQVIIINNNNNNNNTATGIAGENAAVQPKRKTLGTRIASVLRFGYGSIDSKAIAKGILDDIERQSYLRFFHLGLGFTMTADMNSLWGAGFYLSARATLVREGRFPILGLGTQTVSLDNRDFMLGFGFDLGYYMRRGLWGKDMGGGLGGGLYISMNMLGGNPSSTQPPVLLGAGLMLDVYITGNFGLSASLELMLAWYKEDFGNDFIKNIPGIKESEFRALGPSFTLGIIVGLVKESVSLLGGPTPS